MAKPMTPTQLELPLLHRVVNVASVQHRSIFRYPGGKTWLVPHARRWLLSLPKPPKLFVEPFAGGAITGLTVAFEQLAEHVLLVELDKDVAAVWQAVLSGKGEALAKKITSFNLTVETAKEVLAAKYRSTLDKAFATILKNRVQHGGIMAPGASLMLKGEKGKGIASRWYAETLAKRIRDIATVRERISFIAGDAFKVIAEHKKEADTVFFVDPPYTIAGGRLYTHSEIDHKKLFKAMAAVKGNVLMTYDDTPEVKGWASEVGLSFTTVAMKSRQHTLKTELLIGRDLSWTGTHV